MASQADLDKIQAWRQAGLLEPPAVLERLSRAVENTLKHSDDHGALDNLRANFAAVCSPNQTLTMDSLSRWIVVHLAADAKAMGNPVTNVPALTTALAVLFRGMRRMSAHPFSATATPSEEAGITFDGLLRVLFWLVPAKELVRMTLRYRSPAEQRRAVFAALATKEDHAVAAAADADRPFDEAHWRLLAHRRAREFPAHELESWGGASVEDMHNVWDTRDDAGDELVYDVVDVLHLTQEDVDLGVAQVEWASFKAVAAELAKDEPVLREMVVGSRELRLVVDAMMPLQGWLTYAGTRLPVGEVGADCTDALVAAFEVGGGRRGLGANYEMFDRVLATAAPALMNPFHLLLEALTKAPPDLDAEPETVIPVAQTALAQRPREGILTYDRLAQLRTFLQGRAGEPVEDLKLKWEWDNSSSSSAVPADGDAAGALAKSMDSAVGETFLLVTGSSTDLSQDKTFTFGFYSARGAQDKPGMEDSYPTDDDVSVPAIFELAPVQSAFRGVLGKPAWAVCGEQGSQVLQFGDRRAGASLRIDLSIGQATFTHEAPISDEEDSNLFTAFRPAAWRSSYDLKVDVKRLEVWFQDE